MSLLLKIYKNSLSPILHFLFPGTGCRYRPTCSEYAVEVIEKYGIIKGVMLAVKRLVSCNSFTNS